MNVICVFEALSVLHLLALAVSLQEISQSKPQIRKTFRYEVVHPKSALASVRRPFSSRLEISTQFTPSYLPPAKLQTQPPPVLPNILENIFHQAPNFVKEVTNNFLTDYFFIPNTNNEPAASLGQIENYKKDLEELAKEKEEERNRVNSQFRQSELKSREPKLFVSVNSGLYNYNYTV